MCLYELPRQTALGKLHGTCMSFSAGLLWGRPVVYDFKLVVLTYSLLLISSLLSSLINYPQ